MAELKQKVVKGAIWTLLEKLLVQSVQFVVGMVLSRLLTPDDYGTVALTTIFFVITNIFVDAGFAGALIQKKDADELDFNSVYYLNCALSLVGFVAIFFIAPLAADFYNTPVLKNVLRVSAITFLFAPISALQGTVMSKKMMFHLSIRVSIVRVVMSAICGITLAVLGYGVWAFVWSGVVSHAVGAVLFRIVVGWRPRLMFSWQRLKPLFSYGWKMTLTALIDQIFVNLNGILIGKFYTKADLSYVNKGNGLPQLLMGNVDGTIERVSFPALAQLQNDKIRLRDATRRMMICSTYLVFPLMVGLAGCSRPLIRLLYGNQWDAAVPYMMLACFSFALWPLHTVNLRGIMVLGRSDIFLKLEIVKKTLRVIFILAFFRYGVFAFVAACAFSLGPLSAIINAWPNRKLLNYPLRMQIMDILPTVLVCVAEAAAVFGIDWIFKVAYPFAGRTTASLYGVLGAELALQVGLGAVVFLVLSYLFKLKPFNEYVKIVSPMVVKYLPWAGRLKLFAGV